MRAAAGHPARRSVVETATAQELSGTLAAKLAACLDAACRRWPLHAPWTAERRRRYLFRQVTAPSPDRRVWVVREADALAGLAVVSRLPWDSALYGLSMAKLECVMPAGSDAGRAEAAARLVEEAVSSARAQRIDHLAARVAFEDHEVAQALEARGFRYADTTVTLCRHSRTRLAPTASAGIRQATEADVPALERLAAETFLDGRVDHDPGLPAATNRELYRRWVANDCRGRSQAVFVKTERRAVIGFVCCNLDAHAREWAGVAMGFVDLLGVAPRRQGRGVGRALLRCALRYLAREAEGVEIRTQLGNSPSLALYEQEGFRLMPHGIVLPSGHAFHGWIQETS